MHKSAGGIISGTFGGERPLFGIGGAALEGVTVTAGESALKHCRGLTARGCRFGGKYPFWHCEDVTVEDSVFEPGARAAIWYSRGVTLRRCTVEAPKMFRDMRGIALEDVVFTDGAETLWACEDIRMRNVRVEHCDYLFMRSRGIDIDGYVQHGNYTFQWCRGAVIRNAVIDSRDAFWNAEDVTVYDSVVGGEFLGWHSRNLRLVNCRVTGIQPLCYCRGLVLENCSLGPECNYCFEYSDVTADLTSPVTSVRNPLSGSIRAPSCGEAVIDGFWRSIRQMLAASLLPSIESGLR
ncbi:MAG: DUF3737 family protein [Duodenibacillus sp.]|nr:DUF3737 family protein [Duodenibacillus sp.]